jgi:uncharacterized coiled-coil protein SlyX
MRTPLFLAFAALAAAMAGEAAAVVRCESPSGKVTYSNAECPPGTKEVRKLDLSPPVVVHDSAKTAAKTDKPLAATKIEPAKAQRQASPAQLNEELSAQIAIQRRECESRARQLQHLQDDLRAASEGARSSAELALRRAQDEYETVCGKRR